MTDYDVITTAITTIKKRWIRIIVSGIIFAAIFVDIKNTKEIM